MRSPNPRFRLLEMWKNNRGRYLMIDNIIRFDEIASTNDYLKTCLPAKKDLTVVAKVQTGGRGTKGRAFSSALGGLYISFLRFYSDFPAEQAFSIMQQTAVAVCETLAFFGVTPKIKWPNDIYVGGKKICGILIENVFSGRKISSSIVGIGLNVYNLLPEELSTLATTLEKETGKRFTIAEVEEKLLYFLEIKNQSKYREYLGFLGERAVITSGEEKVWATLLGVEENGALAVDIDGQKKTFSSAEISVKVR